MYPHIYQINLAARFYGKITGQSNVQILRSWEKRCFCRSHSIVPQSNHFTTAPGISEFTHVSPFSSTVMKRQFSWSAFLNIWRHHLFAGDGFAGARSIDSTTFSFKHKTFLQMAPWFWRSIRLAASWMQCSLQKISEKLFFCFVSFMHVHSTS